MICPCKSGADEKTAKKARTFCPRPISFGSRYSALYIIQWVQTDLRRSVLRSGLFNQSVAGNYHTRSYNGGELRLVEGVRRYVELLREILCNAVHLAQAARKENSAVHNRRGHFGRELRYHQHDIFDYFIFCTFGFNYIFHKIPLFPFLFYVILY